MNRFYHPYFALPNKFVFLDKTTQLKEISGPLIDNLSQLNLRQEGWYWSQYSHKVKNAILDLLISKLPKIPNLGVPRFSFQQLLKSFRVNATLPDVVSLMRSFFGQVCDGLDDLDLYNCLIKFVDQDLPWSDIVKYIKLLKQIKVGDFSNIELADISFVQIYFPDFDLSKLIDMDVWNRAISILGSIPYGLEVLLDLPDLDVMRVYDSIVSSVLEFLGTSSENSVLSDILDALDNVQLEELTQNILAGLQSLGPHILDILGDKLTHSVVAQLGSFLGVNKDVLNLSLSVMKYIRTGNFVDLVKSLLKTKFLQEVAATLGISADTLLMLVDTGEQIVSLVSGLMSGNPLVIVLALDSLGIVNKLLDFIRIPRKLFDAFLTVLTAVCASNPFTAAFSLAMYLCGGTIIGAVLDIYKILKNWDLEALFNYLLNYGELVAAALTEAIGKILGLFGTPAESKWPKVQELTDCMAIYLKRSCDDEYIGQVMASPAINFREADSAIVCQFLNRSTLSYQSKYSIRP